MRFCKTHDPDVLAAHLGGGALQILLSALLLVLGALAAMAALGVMEMEAEAPPWAGILIGAALAAGGLGLLTYRWGFALDRRRGVLTHWRSVLGLRRVRQIPLEQLERVVLSREVRDADSARTYSVYPVRLEGEGKPVNLYKSTRFRDAKATAEHVAKVFRLVLVDLTESE